MAELEALVSSCMYQQDLHVCDCADMWAPRLCVQPGGGPGGVVEVATMAGGGGDGGEVATGVMAAGVV